MNEEQVRSQVRDSIKRHVNGTPSEDNNTDTTTDD